MRVEDNLPQMRAFAYRQMRLAYVRGASGLSFEDVMQELAIAWCLARDSYRPDGGASFSTYLHRGMSMHMRSFMNRRLERAVGSDHAKVSLDAEIDGEVSLHEALPSAHPALDEALNERQEYRFLLKRVSERARMFLTLLVETPPEILSEFEKARQHFDYARSQGVDVSRSTLNLSNIIFSLMGLTRREQSGVLSELKLVGASLCAER